MVTLGAAPAEIGKLGREGLGRAYGTGFGELEAEVAARERIGVPRISY